MKNLKPREMSPLLVPPAASLLSFQLLNKGIIFVLDDDERDIHDFIRKTSACYCSLMADMILRGLRDETCALILSLITKRQVSVLCLPPARKPQKFYRMPGP